MNIPKGFHRLGLLLASAPMLSAVFFSAILIWGGGRDKTDPFWFTVVSIVAAILVYAATRAIGWVVEGFRE